MATKIIAAIDGHSRYLTADAPSASAMPFLFDLDSETLRCVAGGAGTNWECDRGVNSSGASAHAAETAIAVPKLEQFAATLVDGLIPKATEFTSGTTEIIPSFQGPTDPTTIPELNAVAVLGSIWIDTTYGPPFAQKQLMRLADPSPDGDPAMWGSVSLVSYNAGVLTAQVSVAGVEVSAVVYDTDGNETAHLSLNGSVGSAELRSGANFLTLQGGLLTWTGSLNLPTIPTSDPLVAGAVWNNLGTLTISAGGA
jgi:hypothetical protein